MLTEAIVSSAETIKALPEDLRAKVVAEVVSLGQNAEAAIVAAKKAEWATRDEQDILKITGIEKGKTGDGKSESYWEYRNRVLGELNEKAKSAADRTEVDRLTKELNEAKTALKNNTGDATLKQEVELAKQALADEKSRVAAYEQKIKQVQEQALKQVQDERSKLNLFRSDMEFERAKANFKFEDEAIMPKEVRETFARSAYERVMSNNAHEWRKDSNGNETLVFLKPDGTIDYNPEKGLAPYTLADKLEKEFAPILAKGHSQAGAGTKAGAGTSSQTVIVDLGFAKSKAQVNEIIRADLAKQGLSVGHPDYNKRYDAAKAQVKDYDKLPLTLR